MGERSFFGRMSDRLSAVIGGKNEIDEDLFEEIEEIIITSDIGMDTTEYIMDRIRNIVEAENLKKAESMKIIIKKLMMNMVDKGERNQMSSKIPLVILVVGINGGGKTTTIGKLGNRYINEGRSVTLVAADTFRAAAGDQLEIWADRIGAGIVRHREGADPAAVIYDGIQSAKAKNVDVLICDTAGRMQNKKNLMAELEKIDRIIEREYPNADRETLLVLDATTGKNAISQAQEFDNVSQITGVVITKLDGTAKGGIALTVSNQFDMPIKFIGVGEKKEDLQAFLPKDFVGGIFDE